MILRTRHLGLRGLGFRGTVPGPFSVILVSRSREVNMMPGP